MTTAEWRAVFKRLGELVEAAESKREWGDEAHGANGTLRRLLFEEAERGVPPEGGA